MGQAQINVRTRACSGTSIARTKQAALTHNVRGKEFKKKKKNLFSIAILGSRYDTRIAGPSIAMHRCIDASLHP